MSRTISVFAVLKILLGVGAFLMSSSATALLPAYVGGALAIVGALAMGLAGFRKYLLPVAGIVEQYFGLGAYMQADALAALAHHRYLTGSFEQAVQLSNIALRLGLNDRWDADAVFTRIKRDEAIADGGFVRSWPREFPKEGMHIGYAVQWFGFAVIALIIYLRFSLERESQARLAVYDIAGRKVRSLLDAKLGVGVHSVIWNGQDDAGRGLPSGTYVARLRSGGLPLGRDIAEGVWQSRIRRGGDA